MAYARELPLTDMGWDDFEAFCHDFLSRLPEYREVHRYGTSGEKQLGIDHYADHENGERHSFQCKQRQSCDAALVGSAVQAHTYYKSDRQFLLVSCAARTSARDKIDGHPTWELWDGRDISIRVRTLSPEAKWSLVVDHFGLVWAKAFCGYPGNAPFLAPQEFLAPFNDRTRRFHHSHHLVGRAGVVEKLVGLGAGGQRVAILPGRGGMGKTRILAEVSSILDRRPGLTVLFAVEGVATAASFDQLPSKPVLLVVDDAHRWDHLAGLAAAAFRRHQPTLLLLACRPHGLAGVRSSLQRAGYDSTHVLELSPFWDLGAAGARRLAEQVLGHGGPQAERLAQVSRDCPLVTVVGGALLREKRLEPARLERDEEFRAAVLARFRDEMLGTVTPTLGAERARSLCLLVSALQPLRIDDDALLQAMAREAGCRSFEVLPGLEAMEQAGVLERRGQLLRLVPDVLADHLLHEACVAVGRATGFAERAFALAGPSHQAEVLRNLAELDWRIRASTSEPLDVLGQVWLQLSDRFQDAGNRERGQLLDSLAPAASYQPRRILELARLAIDHPAPVGEEDPMFTLLAAPYTSDDVLGRLPDMVERAAYSFECLPDAVALLWELAQRPDVRWTARSQPMDALARLAGYDRDKPTSWNETVVEQALRWLRLRNQAPLDRRSGPHPLDVLDAVLAKTGERAVSTSTQVTWEPFLVLPGATRPLRARVLDAAAEMARGPHLPDACRALKTLEHALADPMPGTYEVTEDQRRAWVPEQLEVLARLTTIARDQALDDLVRVLSATAGKWQARRGQVPAVRQAARSLWACLPTTLEARVTTALVDQDALSLGASLGFDEPPEDPAWEAGSERSRGAYRRLADDLVAGLGSPDAVWSCLNVRMSVVAQWGQRTHLPACLLEALGELHPTVVVDLARHCLERPDQPVVAYLDILLGSLRQHDPAVATELASAAAGCPEVRLRQAAAWVIRRPEWWASEQPGDTALVQALLADPVVQVRTAVLQDLGRALPDPARSVALALSAPVEADWEVAEALCQCLSSATGDWSHDCPSLDQARQVLSQLEHVATIERHWTQAFLRFAVARHPEATVAMLLARIERAGGDGRAEPIPSHWDETGLSAVSTSPDHAKVLRQVGAYALAAGDADLRGMRASLLFAALAGGYGPTAQQALIEWINEGADGLDGALQLLRQADPDFVFREVAFVEGTLRVAAGYGPASLRSAGDALLASAFSGQLFPQEEQRRDASRPLADVWPRTAPLERSTAGWPRRRSGRSPTSFAAIRTSKRSRSESSRLMRPHHTV